MIKRSIHQVDKADTEQGENVEQLAHEMAACEMKMINCECKLCNLLRIDAIVLDAYVNANVLEARQQTVKTCNILECVNVIYLLFL